jgi:hypothetical protein
VVASPSSATSRVSSPVPLGGVALDVTATTGPSWLSVKSSGGAQRFEGVLAQGVTQSFTDPVQLSVILGNAGAVSLRVNGRDLGPAGEPGTVERLTFDRSDT